MATFNTTTEEVIESGSDFKLLPSSKYIMQCVNPQLVPNTFKTKKHPDDPDPMQVAVTWELKKLSPVQQQMLDDGDLEDDETLDIGTRVFQYMTPTYGVYKDRDTGETVATQWKQFVDTLKAQGIIGDIFDIEDLEGVVQLVTVNKVMREKGKNKGKMGNKVAKVGPLPSKKAPTDVKPSQPPRRTAVATPAPQTDDSDIPF